MCSEPLYAIRLKTEFDKKFQRFGIRTPIKVLCNVRDIGKETSKLNYDRVHYDLLMISCGQCLQCRLLKVKQRSVMCMCEMLDHEDNSFITLTFGYPQLYSYYRHQKKLSHYLATKKCHFHEWSLEVEFFQKFMKRLRTWHKNYEMCNHLINIGRSDLVPSSYPYVTHLYLKCSVDEKKELFKDFKYNKIRCMHVGEYGSKHSRPHHHAILHGFQFPDLQPIYEKGQTYYTSEILSKLWPFGIHRIGECTYQSCAYVARYVTKKMNGNNKDEFYEGRKPEYVTYSSRPVLGANYFKENYKEFINTGKISVITDKKYECNIPKSYDNIIKSIDVNAYNEMKEKRINDCKNDFEKLLKQDRSIYSKLDSQHKIALFILRDYSRVYENSGVVDIDSFLKKAKAFGINTKFFTSVFSQDAIDLLNKKSYKDHKSRNSNDDLHKKYYDFELARKRHISHAYNVNHSDERVNREVEFFKNIPNPFKCVFRGHFIPDKELCNEDSYIDKKGKEIIL